MPGFLDFLFGADGPGGQPGAVGNTLNNGIANTVLGGVGKVIAPTGNAAVGGLGDWLADVTTKNPLEILKNPSSVLNDQGQISLTRLAFPEFRRADVKAKKDQQKLTDLAITSEMYNTGKKAMEALGTAAGTPQGQQQAIDAGVDEDVAAQYGAAQVGAQLRQEAAEETARGLGIPGDIPVEPDQLLNVYVQAQHDDAARAAAGRAAESAERARIRFEERVPPEPLAVKRAREAAERAERKSEKSKARLRSRREKEADAAAERARKAAEAAYEPALTGRSKAAAEALGVDGRPAPTAEEKKAINALAAEQRDGIMGAFRRNTVDPYDGKTAEQIRAEQIEAGNIAAKKVLDEMLPPKSRKAIGAKKRAREEIERATDEAKRASARTAAIDATVRGAKDQGVPLANIVKELVKVEYTPEEIGPQLTLAGYSAPEIAEATRSE